MTSGKDGLTRDFGFPPSDFCNEQRHWSAEFGCDVYP